LEKAIGAAETELAQLRAGTSEDESLDAFLQGKPALDADGFPTSGRLRVGAIEQQLVDLRGARAALCRRIRGAIVDLGKVRADAFRKQAAALQGQLEKHLAKSAELLKELETHTRARYAPDRIGDADILTDGAGRESVFRRGDRPMPRSQELASEIAMLHRKSESAEARAQAATDGGQVSGENLESLLAVCADVERLAPTEAAVRAWFEQASAKAEAEWAATAMDYAGVNTSDGRFQPAPDHDTVYTLAWNTDGVIDLARSTAKNRPNLARLPVAASVGPASDARRW
jgi:hypothetical protein